MEITNKEIENSYDGILPDLLPLYYQRLFPFSLYFKWLKYNDDALFANREFSFTLKDDVYLRYQSFKTDIEMKRDSVNKFPYKIDIGSVYSHRPCEQRTVSNFHPVEKELVFDIDMTDYDEVRTCCSKADICKRCWPFMTVAVKILDTALREDFGFEHILWVYSGRRGVHCWVCDETARKLSASARSAIVEYLSIVKGGEYKTKKVHLPENLHPSLKRAADIVLDHFEDLIVNRQKYFESDENCEQIAAMCLDQNIKELIKTGLLEATSTERWNEFKRMDDIAIEKKARNKNFFIEVLFQLCYPRLDVNVTKGLNHLLKAPFCVHPKTGRICVPFDARNIDSFDPFTVPTIDSLCKEIDDYDAKMKEIVDDEIKSVEDYAKTSLAKSITIFQNFIDDIYSVI